ncbi:hypothetical protein JR316_0010980 [Psilocybe cubensis]|uniref:Uncharacterized protein n=2 Tax=Psilocybe cubensis TaxID=181762 RepID=A0A8H7XMP3_PSICU|nr:hypothetical protein JR316_0010980 [Psilocybe cubensis]KAH9477064.1 hypothetical protein JR316_0010980 [Psilocybe cubensis]
MSDSVQDVGRTLTGGIQDVAGLLPLLGTEQCEHHVGSALAGGYLYAAGAPLSIFGSLGIVKAGISTLVSSISIPKFSISLPMLRVKFSPELWLGSRMLNNAGFKPVGDVANLIAMDGGRYQAETRIIDILQEKQLKNAEKLMVAWKSQIWNIWLLLFSFCAAILGVTPYIALIVRDSQPSLIRTPWIFPLLRTIGSSVAAVCCQFLMQARVISLMKNRIIFIAMHRVLVNELKMNHSYAEQILAKDENLMWDLTLPAEQSLWRLELFLNNPLNCPSESSDEGKRTNLDESCPDPVEPKLKCPEETASCSLGLEEPPKSENPNDGLYCDSTLFPQDMYYEPKGQPHPDGLAFVSSPINEIPDQSANIPMEPSKHVSIGMQSPSFSNLGHLKEHLTALRNKHFPTAALDRIFFLISWIVLCISLPATVVGYVGCFTLVSNSQDNGPLIWLGLEAALSVIRILVWAWNPTWDEDTGVMVNLDLTEGHPMVTTENSVEVIESQGIKKTLPLMPERQFLEWILPYTGPVERFNSLANLSLYFTLTAASRPIQQQRLYMTAFDSNKRIAITLLAKDGVINYIDVTVAYSDIANEMEATTDANAEHYKSHAWRSNDPLLFDMLEEYYKSLVHALNQTGTNQTATLLWNWTLLPGGVELAKGSSNQIMYPLSERDQLYLDRGYEHSLKSELIDNLGHSIVKNMKQLHMEAWDYFPHHQWKLDSEKITWEGTEWDLQRAWECLKRELAVLKASVKLEEVLRGKMVAFCAQQEQEHLREWALTQFTIGRRKRLERERDQARERMNREMNSAEGLAEEYGRPWNQQGIFNPQGAWSHGMILMEGEWRDALQEDGQKPSGIADLKAYLERASDGWPFLFSDSHQTRFRFVKEVRQRLKQLNCDSHRNNERLVIDEKIERIRHTVYSSDLQNVYQYPIAYNSTCGRFADLHGTTSLELAKLYASTVYGVQGCNNEIILEVIKNKTARSVTGVPLELVDSIPENEHLLYISGPDGCKIEQPAFIQRNRDRWWDLQTGNSFMFFHTPEGPWQASLRDFTISETLAQIFVYITTASSIKIRLLHCGELLANASEVYVRHNGEKLISIPLDDLTEELVSESFELGRFEPGRYQMELVAKSHGSYVLQNLFIDFIDEEVPVLDESGSVS